VFIILDRNCRSDAAPIIPASCHLNEQLYSRNVQIYYGMLYSIIIRNQYLPKLSSSSSSSWFKVDLEIEQQT